MSLGEKSNCVDIVLSHLHDLNNEKVVGVSRAWNWQQGVRLRWMPTNTREICFNDFKGGDYISRIINIDTNEERIICKPLYDISPDGNSGLSLDFERLGVKRPGYGYTCRNYCENGIDLSEEGIDIVDIKNNSFRRLLTYKQIAKVAGTLNCSYKNNYINHISYSPDGKKFLFFWLTVGEKNHKADLLVYDFKEGSISLLEDVDRVSHYVWIDDNHILCTAYNATDKCFYYLYDVLRGSKDIVNPRVLSEDGHPCMLDNSTILTDTYPSRDGYQKIYCANVNEGGYKLLANVYNNCMIEGERRTDLHPRLCKGRQIVSFDSNQREYRSLNFLFLKDGIE